MCLYVYIGHLYCVYVYMIMYIYLNNNSQTTK